ncbi:MAG: TldD/PmbA family protein [Chloroflexi bacterium]|nr:TldD/PmbA family protein [Chloroflexota bacterium]
MERILALARRLTEESEVFMVSAETTSVSFEANRLKHVRSKQKTSIALRVIKDGKIGFAQTTDLEEPLKLVNMAVETAAFGMPAKFSFPSDSAYPQVETFDAAVQAVSMEQMIGVGEKLISTVTGHTADILCEAGIGWDRISVKLLNSRGGQAQYEASVSGLGVEGSLIRETDMLFVGEWQDSCHPILEPDAVTGVVLWQLEMAKNRAPISSGQLPVIFTPRGVAVSLASPLMAAFNGKMTLEGASPIGKKRGELVFDRKLWLWDDPTIPFRPQSRPCDDEGVPSQRTALIEGGAVANFLYDLQTAGLAKASSTGNGSRGRGGLPSPSPSAFVIGAGDTTFDDMVHDMKEGLIIEHLMGAEQGNILGGDFSGNVLLGYKVENGKITGRVKDTMVSGNVYQLLKEIRAIGSESRWVGSSVQTPPIYCSGLSVAAKG